MEINATLFGQAITFAILVLFTMKFVWPALNRTLEERLRRISDGLAAAQKSQDELANVQLQVAAELKNVQLRASAIIAKAQEQEMRIIENAKQQAIYESERILLDAEEKIKCELQKARNDLQKQVADLVMLGVKQIVHIEVDRKCHNELLQDLSKKLEHD